MQKIMISRTPQLRVFAWIWSNGTNEPLLVFACIVRILSSTSCETSLASSYLTWKNKTGNACGAIGIK